MANFIKHQVVDMDESMIQNCVLCGEEICDYSNASWPSGQGAPKGYPAGSVFVSIQTSPQQFTREISDRDTYENCKV